MKLSFAKYHGAANDFIMIDDRPGKINLSYEQVKQLCKRYTGIGADGLILLREKAGVDFEMIYYNADGKPGSMCGNGGRCAVKFAQQLGIRKDNYTFLAMDGLHYATMNEDKGWIHLKMQDVQAVKNILPTSYVLNTGSPHYVKPVTDIRNYPVIEEGRKIRYSAEFAQEGINVNFVENLGNKIFVRTYERGVEDETQSCGTGVTASALVYAHNENGFNHIDIQTLGGKLAVEFMKTGPATFTDIWLCGPAIEAFRGEVVIAPVEK